MNFANILKMPFLQNSSGGLLLRKIRDGISRYLSQINRYLKVDTVKTIEFIFSNNRRKNLMVHLLEYLPLPRFFEYCVRSVSYGDQKQTKSINIELKGKGGVARLPYYFFSVIVLRIC